MSSQPTLVLHHHPFTRAASVVWQLEEVGLPYTLRYHDLARGEHKAPELLALNPMGKLPILQDGEVAVSETAAIGLYLADRYAPGRLAPALDDPRRGPWLRACLLPASVIEPACMAATSGWAYRPGNAGWGRMEDVLASIEALLTPGPFVLGADFSMADVLLGATLRYMLAFKMIEPRPSFQAYVDRLTERPAWQRAQAVNARVVGERGLGG